MSGKQEPKSLQELVDRLSEVDQGSGRVTLGAMLGTVGRRSFGALLLVLGVILFSPLSTMFGVSTAVGILVLLVAGQLLFGRDYFWLPGWLLRRGISRSKFEHGLKILRPVARFVDRLTGPRLTALTEGGAAYAIAGASVIIALMMPPLEVLPVASHFAGAALTAFGLGLVARDGLLVIIALAVCLGGIALLVFRLF
jgi:hypothetical protein